MLFLATLGHRQRLTYSTYKTHSVTQIAIALASLAHAIRKHYHAYERVFLCVLNSARDLVSRSQPATNYGRIAYAILVWLSSVVWFRSAYGVSQ